MARAALLAPDGLVDGDDLVGQLVTHVVDLRLGEDEVGCRAISTRSELVTRVVVERRVEARGHYCCDFRIFASALGCNMPCAANTVRTASSMRSMGINTGFAEGYAVIPAITGSSLNAVKLSGQLFDAGLNVQPIIHHAVEEKAARLRFFLSSTHSQDDIDLACETVHTLMKK